MKVLFTSPVLQHPAAGGPQLRIENSIKALSAVCDLYVVSRAAEPLEERERTAAYIRRYCREYQVVPRLECERPAGRVARKIRRVVRGMLDADAREDARFLLEFVDRCRAEVIWFGYGNISFPLMRRIRALRPGLKLVCDTDSVWSRFVLRELPYARGLRKLRISRTGRRKEREERAWVELCDVTAAVSEVDADYYRGLASLPERIQLFPNVIDVASYRTPPPPAPGLRKPCIYLAGTFGHYHSPMDSAARWILDSVFPELLKAFPGLHFYIVGNNSDKGFGHLNGPNITATGRLESVLPYLCHADVALVPLKFESGTRFKILEAGACGIPVVSTTLGAEGIPVVDGRDILIADEPAEFVGAVARLLRDKALASTIAANCRRLVCDQFSVEALVRHADRILAALRRPEPASLAA